MHHTIAAEAVRLRREAQECRLVARLMSLKDDARRLLDMARAFEADAEAAERVLQGHDGLAAT